MAISITHPFVSGKADGADSTRVQPSNWNAGHTLTMATAKLIGRTTAATGAAQEIGVSADLSLTALTLGLSFTVTAFAKTILDDADAAAVRTTLGAAASATTPTLSGDNTFTGLNTFEVGLGDQPVVKSTYPVYKFWDTDGNTGRNRGGFAFADDAVLLTLANSSDTFVNTLWSISYNSSGGLVHKLRVGSVDQLYVGSNVIRPGNDNATDCGAGTFRFDDVFATNTTIQTSDARDKMDFRALTDTDKRAALRIKNEIGMWRWKDSVEEKGDDARYHCGPTVQKVIEIMLEEGIENPYEYAFIIGHPDETMEVMRTEYIEVLDEETGEPTGRMKEVEVSTGVSRRVPMGLRASELQFYILAAL